MGTNPDSDAPATHESRCVAYLETAIDRELEALATTGGHRNNALNATAFAVGQLVAGAEDAGVSVTDLRARPEGNGHELHAEKRDTKHVLPPNHDWARQYLRWIDPNADKFLFAAIWEDKKVKNKRVLHFFSAYDALAPRLAKLNNEGYGIYCLVNENDGTERRKHENIVRRRAVWNEDDDTGQAEGGLPLPASLVIESSPGKFHKYLVIAPGNGPTLQEWDAAMNTLIEVHATKSSNDPKDECRVLRLPGYWNIKNEHGQLIYGEPFQVRHVLGDGTPQPWPEISAKLPPITKAVQKVVTKIGGRAGVDEIGEALDYIEPDPRENWLSVGMALHAYLGDDGRKLWDDWSRKSDKFDAKDQERTWAKFKAGGGKNIASLFFLAERGGCDLRALALKHRPPVTETVDQETGEVLSKPLIRIQGGDLAPMADRAERYLIAAGVPIFQRGGKLVQPVMLPTPDGRGNTTPDVQLVPLSENQLVDLLCQTINWQKFDNRIHDWKDVNAPKDVARILLERQGKWKFPAIAGVLGIPTLRHDGSLLDQPGYDKMTGLYLASNVKLPAMPAKPAKDQARLALAKLKGLLEESPFVDDASRSVILSAMLTAVVRGMLPTAPAHGASASTAGTGKSYLFDTVSAIALGSRGCPVITAPKADPAELEKRINTRAMSGSAIINIDNINGRLESDTLCQLITQEQCMLLVLGKTEDVRVPNRACIFFNGNNVQVAADLTRRVLLARLETDMENPEKRVFKGEPVETVLANRGDYIAACITIVRAYIAAGRPKQAMEPMQGFKDWSNTVRAALIWLGEKDPCETVQAVQDDDPEKQRLIAFLEAAKPVMTGVRWSKTAREIVALAQKMKPFPAQTELEHPELNAVVMEFARGNTVTPQALSGWLRRVKNRPIGRFRITSTRDSHSNVERWFIQDMSAAKAAA